MKGIILAGGTGSRLYPTSQVISKQLMPVYDKPMIYYPLSLLMRCKIREILIISTKNDIPNFKKLLGDGKNLGLEIKYEIQDEPNGIAEAFVIGRKFISDDNVTLILGDNLFYGDYNIFRETINDETLDKKSKAYIFAYKVADPERYGVVEFLEGSEDVLSIEEKPLKPKSSYAIPGLYVFDNSVIEKVSRIRPSKRGELEITDLIKEYIKDGNLQVKKINRGMAWLDTGTPESLLEASEFISAIEQRQGLKIACIEEVAYRSNLINKEKFIKIIEDMKSCSYKNYLINLVNESNFQVG